MKSRNFLSKKFYRDIQQKREQIAENTTMIFKQTLNLHKMKLKESIKNIMLKFLVVWGGKAYAAEQEIWEFKKLLFKIKRVHKATSNKRFGSRKLIRLAVKNMSNIRSQKYGYAPDTIKDKALESNFENVMIFIDL